MELLMFSIFTAHTKKKFNVQKNMGEMPAKLQIFL